MAKCIICESHKEEKERLHFIRLENVNLMARENLVQKYTESIQKLKRECSEAGISEDEFKNLYFETLQTIKETKNHHSRSRRDFTMRHTLLVLGLIIVVCVVYNFRPIYSCLACNLQDLIHPSLKLLRRISIPFISLFPALTELYQETCLINNPFFTVTDMDCWPCSSATSIREVSDFTTANTHVAPFIYHEVKQKNIKINNLKEFYFKNKEVFDIDSAKVLRNNRYYINPEEVFKRLSTLQDKSLYTWKFNTMNVARLLRQIIPRPKVVPKFGQSTERFIIIDSSQESFRIPDTECSFSFLLLLSGTRNLDLLPAEECKNQCKALQVELKESYLLWYNWWYWRPVVQSSLGNITLVAHLGSYC